MGFQGVEEYGGAVKCRDLSVIVIDSLVLILFVVYFLEHFPVFDRLQGQLTLNRNFNVVIVLLFNKLYDVFDYLTDSKCMCTIQDEANFGWIRAVFHFDLPHLILQMEIFDVILELSPKLVNVLCRYIE